MKILTFSPVTLALLVAPTGRAQFVPGPNPIAGTVTAAQSLPSGAGVVSSTGDLEVSGSSVAITVTGQFFDPERWRDQPNQHWPRHPR